MKTSVKTMDDINKVAIQISRILMDNTTTTQDALCVLSLLQAALIAQSTTEFMQKQNLLDLLLTDIEKSAKPN